MPILRKTAQIGLVIVILIPILRLLEVNLTALIAGLSIGGIALALAAQDTVKNLISSALIFFDKPYQIGDYIVAGGVEGTVVEIGFRSTRMMTIDSSIIAVPNSNMINDRWSIWGFVNTAWFIS
ncbi:MAG: mechanosensitive ion channel [Saprospiraceae bacterium]|nr:mechanosensitive ion channel [Saprospiraceae bacterium]